VRPLGNPPPVISSRPLIPLRAFGSSRRSGSDLDADVFMQPHDDGGRL